MSITVSMQTFQSKERKAIIEEIQRQMQKSALRVITNVMAACLEAEVTAKLGREKGSPCQISGQAHEINWKCGHGGCQDANQFARDGHYKRSLVYEAAHAQQARERFRLWAQQWRPQALATVSTLECDFESTLVYYQFASP